MTLAQPDFPATKYPPPPVIDLTRRDERERLSPAALRAFFNIVDRWRVRDEDARVLLGGLSNGPYYKWRKDPERTLDTDMLTRLSYLIGIFKALNILYGQAIADEWVKLANSNPIFAGRTPLAYMMTGGIPALQTVRRLLDARRGGV